MSVAKDWSDDFELVGTLDPSDTDVTGRTGVSSSDTVYLLRFPGDDNAVKTPSLSVKLTADLSDALEILHLELVADPIDSQIYK